jgi:hypothetical protein
VQVLVQILHLLLGEVLLVLQAQLLLLGKWLGKQL